MNKRRLVSIICLVFLAIVLSGCTTRSTMLSSFQDITSESQVLGCPVAEDRQYSALSIPGLIAAPAPGFLYSFNPRRGPTTAIGISGDGTTYVVTKTSDPMAENATIVSEIKECMEDIKSLSMQAIQLRMDQALEKLDERMAVTKKTILDSLAEAVGELAEPGSGKSPLTVTEIAEAAKKAAAKPDDDQPAGDAGNTGGEAQQPGDTTKTLKQIMADLADKEKALAGLLSNPGILVFRWESTNASSNSATVSKVMGHTADSSKSLRGYAIISGLRVANLYVGQDIHTMWAKAKDIGFFRDWTQVTTMVAQARKIAYVTELDYEQLFQIQAELNMERLGKIAADWKNALELSLAASIARVGQMSNTGYIGDDVKIKRYSLFQLKSWAEGSGKIAEEKAEAQAEAQWFLKDLAVKNKTKAEATFPFDGWTTFYQVNTSLDTLQKMILKTPAQPSGKDK